MLTRLIFSVFAYLSLEVNATATDEHIELLRGTFDKVSCNELSSINALVNELVHQSQDPAALLSAFMQQQQAKQTLCAIEASHVNKNSVVARSELSGAISLTPDIHTHSQNANLDTRAPELVSITLSKQSIDFADGPQQVEVVLRVRDESDLGLSTLRAYAPEGFNSNFNKAVTLWPQDSSLAPRWQVTTEPNVYEGTVTFTFDENSPAGVWNLRPFTLEDNLGNQTPIISRQQMLDWGFDTDVVIISSEVIDTKAPVLLSVDLSQQVLDLSEGPQQISMTLRVRDEGDLGLSTLRAYAPEGFNSNFNKAVTLWPQDSSLAPRWQVTTEPDVYEGTVTFTFDENSPAGVWNLRPFTLEDSLGNQTPIISRQQMLDWGFNSDVYVNTAPDPDIAVNSNVPFYFIEPTTEGQVTFTIGAEQGSTLPQSLSLRFNASQGLQYRGFRLEGAGAYGASCQVVNGVGTCQLGLAAGLSSVRAVFTLQPSAAQDYPFSLAVNSENRELNYQNNNLTVLVTGIKPVFTATAVIKGKGQVLPSSQQIPLGEVGRFEFIPDDGYKLQEFSGCNASMISGQLNTGDISADCELVVSFAPIVFPVEVVVAPENGQVSCNVSEAAFGSSITCLAVPAKGFKFVGWKNSQCQGQARSCELVVNGIINLQPEFAPITSKRKPLPLWLFVQS